ncbi:MAG: hypothetical protein K5846_05425 [Bacteroidales bacterium]|nr:hypothetical protein [Bacteroidales bacterium]
MSEEKFQNKYRIKSVRAAWHDYNGGGYFVTICTRNREHYFGEISGGVMHLTPIGRFANDCLMKMEMLHDDVQVPIWQVMPDHIHAIVIIENAGPPYHDGPIIKQLNVGKSETIKNVYMQNVANKCGRLSHIISRMKTAVSKYARQNDQVFGWQLRFYDRIIRNGKEMNRIATYIEQNVAKWESGR